MLLILSLQCHFYNLKEMKKREIKILLVDDEPDILEIVGYNLSSEGYDVITAENGLEAVKKAKKEKSLFQKIYHLVR